MLDEKLRLNLDPLGCELLPDLRAESHAPLLTRQYRVAGQVGLHFQQPQTQWTLVERQQVPEPSSARPAELLMKP